MRSPAQHVAEAACSRISVHLGFSACRPKRIGSRAGMLGSTGYYMNGETDFYLSVQLCLYY